MRSTSIIGCLCLADLTVSWAEAVRIASQYGPLLYEEPPSCLWVELAALPLSVPHATVRLGVATTRWASWIAARDGLGVIAAGREAEAVASVLVADLELTPEAKRQLQWLGLTTLGAVREVPSEALSDLLGEQGRRLAQWAQGLDPEEWAPLDQEEPLLLEVAVDPYAEWGAQNWGGLYEAVAQCVGSLAAKGRACRELQIDIEGEGTQRERILIRWNTPIEGVDPLWEQVRARLERHRWTFAPHRLQIQSTAAFQLVGQQVHFLQPEKTGWQRLRQMALDGYLQGVMRCVWDRPDSWVPDEVAHLEDMVDPTRRRPLCLPRPLEVRIGGEGRAQQVYTQGGWAQVENMHQQWEVEMRWWRAEPLWRRYAIAMVEQLGPVRMFCEPLTGRWFRH